MTEVVILVKLIEVHVNEPLVFHLPPVEWKFKKHHVNGIIRKKDDQYYYILYHPSFKELKSDKYYSSLEEAAKAAEQFINTWYHVQGRLLALK